MKVELFTLATRDIKQRPEFRSYLWATGGHRVHQAQCSGSIIKYCQALQLELHSCRVPLRGKVCRIINVHSVPSLTRWTSPIISGQLTPMLPQDNEIPLGRKSQFKMKMAHPAGELTQLLNKSFQSHFQRSDQKSRPSGTPSPTSPRPLEK